MAVPEKVNYEKPITDCAHLIDLPATNAVFNHKVKGNAVTNPKAGIRLLSAFYPKNGLINLL